jgi:hypothetical protein
MTLALEDPAYKAFYLTNSSDLNVHAIISLSYIYNYTLNESVISIRTLVNLFKQII